MEKTNSILKFIWLTIRHKWFVFWAGLQVRAPIWNLLIHDLSKFSWHELPHYAQHSFMVKKDHLKFSKAWNHHSKRNPHHWEYWVLVSQHHSGQTFNSGEALPMPEKYIRELVADWLAVQRAKDGNYPCNLKDWDWFKNNINKVNLHPKTKYRIYQILHNFFKKQKHRPRKWKRS